MAVGLASRRAGDDPERLGGGRRARERGSSSDEELAELERDACPGIGSCTGHFTANTMAVAVDFLGLGPVGLGRDHGDRSREAGRGRAGGAARPRRDCPRESAPRRSSRPRGSATRSSASPGTGGSTNSVLHLLAIADEAGVPLELEDFDRLSASTPVVTSLTPGGRFVAGDLQRVGGTRGRDEAAARRTSTPTRRPSTDERSASTRPPLRDPDGEVIAPIARAVQAGWRVAGPARQPRAGRRRRQARRPRAARSPWAGARLRIGGAVQGGGLRRRRAAWRGRRRPRRGAGRARPACPRCSRSPPRSSAAGSATRLRSSPTAGSAARRAG